MTIKHINSILLAFSLIVILVACKNDASVKKESASVIETTETIDSTLIKFGIDKLDPEKMGGLTLGESAPNFAVDVLGGNTFNLAETLENQEVLLVFYRGYWCGYCQRHLGELEEKLQDFEDKGIKVIAITPESPEYAEKSIEKSDLSIDIIPDQGYEIMKQYKVLFEVNEFYLDKLAGYEIDYDKDPVSGKTFFPVPATYLIGKDGKVKFAHYDPDYSQRSDVEALLNM